MVPSLSSFLAGVTSAPFKDLLDLLSLPPERIGRALGLLAAFMVACEWSRIALGTTLTRSALAHVVRCLLTFVLQSIVLAVVLVLADRAYPGRGWINLGYALLLYVIWYLAGQVTSLVRADNEGADLGFMTVGALITFPVGIVAALLT